MLDSFIQSRLTFLDAYIRALTIRHQLFDILVSNHTSADVQADAARLLDVPLDVARAVLSLPLSYFGAAPPEGLEEEARSLRRIAGDDRATEFD